MQLFQRILNKEEIQSRFIEAVYGVLRTDKSLTKSTLADSLGAKPAKFSEILNGRMKAGVDMIATLCEYYNVSPDWVLMSRGKILRDPSTMPPIMVYEGNYEELIPVQREIVQETGTNIEAFLSIIKDKDDVIREQAEEIGRLRERVSQLERMLEKNASGAATSTIAGVG